MGISYNPNIVSDNMLVNLDVGNIKSYTNNATNIKNLINLNSNTGANIIASPIYSSNNKGYLTLNGTSQYIHRKIFPAISSADELSYNVWIRILSYPGSGQQGIIFGTEDVYICSFVENSGNLGFSFLLGGGPGYDFTNIYSLPLNTWLNLCVTVSVSDSARIYINGNLISTIASPVGMIAAFSWYAVSVNNSLVIIGHVNCDFSYLSIYDRVLSQDEILRNFNALRGRFSI